MSEQHWKKLASAFNLMGKELFFSTTFVLVPLTIPILAIAWTIIFFKMLNVFTETHAKEAFWFGVLIFLHMIIATLYMIELLGVLSRFIGLELPLNVSITSIDYTVLELLFSGLLTATYTMLKKFFANRTAGLARSNGMAGASFVRKTAFFFLIAILFRYLDVSYLLIYYATIIFALYFVNEGMKQIGKAFAYLAKPGDQQASIQQGAGTQTIPYFSAEPASIPSQIYCGNCGEVIPPESGSQFCPSCGAKLET